MSRPGSRFTSLIVLVALGLIGAGCGGPSADQVTSVRSSASGQASQTMSNANEASSVAEDKAEAKAGLPPDEPISPTKSTK